MMCHDVYYSVSSLVKKAMLRRLVLFNFHVVPLELKCAKLHILTARGRRRIYVWRITIILTSKRVSYVVLLFSIYDFTFGDIV